MKRELSFLAAFLSALFVCSCKNNDANEDCLQITKHDVIELEGSFDDNYLESWDYILLDDDNLDGILGNNYIAVGTVLFANRTVPTALDARGADDVENAGNQVVNYAPE